jgi:hypothetical protein
MERLYFVCPNTGADVDAGIETELKTLLRIRNEKVRVKCPACGREHEWSVSEAHLIAAA